MKYLVNSNEMRQYDKNTSEVLKVPSLLLMEQAALGACEEVEKMLRKSDSILIACGVGNNGGDGLALARLLFLKGYSVYVLLVGDEYKATEQNEKQREILMSYGVSILREMPKNTSYSMIVDALFGVGLTRPIAGEYKTIIENLNNMPGIKVALDIPSGVSADNGHVLGIAFCADKTITFAFDKVGLHLWPGNEYTGEIIVKEIGITEHSFLGNRPMVAACEDVDLKPINIRPSHSNKGTFGRLLVIAGTVNMAGAAILTGKGAYASGCGLVRILTPEENRVIIQTSLPEAILSTYSINDLDEEAVKSVIAWADAVLIGPGLGTNNVAERILKLVLDYAKVPVVLDADALNILAKNMELLSLPHPEMIITPHMMEMSRLTGKSIEELQAEFLEAVRAFADTYHVTCVLKDERTATSIPESMTYLNLSGNAGMATAGSGDVLAGIIGSLMAQGYHSADAAPLAVYLHGVAGDCMVKETGKAGLVAADLVEGIRRILGCKERGNDIL